MMTSDLMSLKSYWLLSRLSHFNEVDGMETFLFTYVSVTDAETVTKFSVLGPPAMPLDPTSGNARGL